MRGDDQMRTIEPGYSTQDVTKVPGWHGLVAWDLLFNNLTTGLFLFAAVGELASPGLLGPVAKAAYPVALVFLLTDLMLLVLDLGDPLRFHHMLRVFKPSSPMSLGTWSLTVYSLPLTLIVAIEAAQALDLLPPGSIVAGMGTQVGGDRRVSCPPSDPSPTRGCSSARARNRAGRTPDGWAVLWPIPHSCWAARRCSPCRF